MRYTACLGVMAALALALTGCVGSRQRAYEYMPDMARGAAYKAFAPNKVTRDGLTLQRPVAGTIPRGYHPFHYGPGDDEAARAGRELKNPYQPTARTLDEGKALFQTYCMVCHGEEGKGDGPIAGKIPTPPSYVSQRLMEFPQGRIFHVITLGYNKMPSYASQLSADERWKIVAYVKTTLQSGGAPENNDKKDAKGVKSAKNTQSAHGQRTARAASPAAGPQGGVQ